MTNARQAKSAREKAAAMQAEAAKKEARRKTVWVGAAVVAALGVIVGAFFFIQSRPDNSASTAATASGGTGAPKNFTDYGFTVGKASAPVTIKAYEDFQCPACEQFETANKAQIEKWVQDGTAKVVFKPIAILDRMSTGTGTDQYSTRAMNALAAVGSVSPAAFVAMHDLLYANQPQENSPGLTNAKLVELAVQAGASEAAVKPLIDNLTYGKWVAAATNQATTKDAITGTPTVYVNGTDVKDWSPDKLAAAVTAAAKSAGASASPSATASK